MKILTFLLYILFITIFGENTPKVKCPLTWQPLSYDGNIPSKTVSTHNKEQFIAAAKSVASSSNYDLVGRYDAAKGKVFAVLANGQVVNSREVLLLSNPWGCKLEWLTAFDNQILISKFGVSLNSTRIGRKEVENKILGGDVNTASNELQIVVGDSTVRRYDYREYQVLTSYSPGLKMKINKMEYRTDPFTNPYLDIIGLDIVKNEVDSEVSFTVTHSKQIDNSYYFWEKKQTTISCKSLFGLREETVTKESELEKSSGLKLNITVTKTVTVAPFQSVEVCTVIRMSADNFKSDFNAIVEFSAPGLSSEEVLEHIREEIGYEEEEGYTARIIAGGALLVSFTGTFEGALASKAETRVLPLGNNDGCVEHERKQRLQNQQTFQEMKKELEKRRKQNAEKTQRKSLRDGWDPLKPVTFTLYSKSYCEEGAALRIGNIDDANKVMNNTKTVFATHGFTSNGGHMTGIKDAILSLNTPYNVIVVDWNSLASIGLTPWDKHNYLAARDMTKVVGLKIAQMVKFLVQNSRLTYNDLHIMGHSLGAHVAGYAGAYLDGKASRVTGLDPAGPLYDGVCFKDRLDPTDGRFVDVIHTDGNDFPELAWNGFGYFSPLGDADFYPNGGIDQPDSGGNGNDHQRAVDLMVDSINICEDEFQACRCNNYGDYPNQCDCRGNNRMGFYASPSSFGRYYLNTKGNSPYCL